jgi:leucyl aminopeptidase
MNFDLVSQDLTAAAEHDADALVVLWPEVLKPGRDALSQLGARALRSGDWELKAGRATLWLQPTGIKTPRVVLACVGSGSAAQARQAALAAWAALKGMPVKRVVLHQVGATDTDQARAALAAAATAVADASYVYTLTAPKATARALTQLTLSVPLGENPRAAWDATVTQVRALHQGKELAREWANRPANHCTPTLLAQAAQGLARKHRNLSCEVLGPREVAKLKMGSFMAVAQGSAEPLRFIVLRYKGASAAQAPVVLVGKGITFDTGGISIKPAPDMDEMKFDMSGAASVLGTFGALAVAKPAINVVGLIPACENMPDGRAVKPGDVVTSMSGQTIEILNTDAEGRLILCDALTYAQRFEPRAVIDIATLTGACVIALGAVRSGLFSTDDALAQALEEAGEAELDPCWRMPLDDDYAEGLKTHFADVANVGGRAAGAVTAAKFLQRFATGFPWAHLDIAGTAWKSGAAKGATGRPVALLLRYLVNAAQQPAAPVAAASKRAAKRSTVAAKTKA